MNDVHVETSPLAGVDLNLLVAFDALAQECSVTRAAARVGVTQSAMSHALRRLRELLGDPLLVRGGGGMILTPRAESLAIPLRSGLVTLHRALNEPVVFDAASSTRAFRMSSPDLFDVVMLPPLLERVRDQAPGVEIAVVAVPDRQLVQQLETGELDVAVVPRGDDPTAAPDPVTTSGLVRRTLFRDRLVCVLRADHPALRSRRRRLSLTQYAALSHAMVSPSGTGRGPVDYALAERGLQRHVVLRVPNFYTALAVVARSDLAMTGPTALMKVATDDHPIVAVKPPLPLPGHSIDLIWHERFSHDPGHRWFRERVVEVAKAP